ncbi:MAG: hypothetical protein ACLGJC_10050 [Alphaproteobacteria bacterium]
MAERKQIDWEAIEREYRAGQLSVSEIGRQQGVSHTAINKKAKAQGWTRNLTEKVRQEVSARLVSDGVSADNVRQTVELAAARGVEVVRSHRQDISSARSLVRLLMGQLVEAATSRDQIEDAIHAETSDDDNAQRRNQMLRAVSLSSHAGVAKDLSAALKNLIPLERQAFNLDADEEPDDDKPRVTIYIPSNGRD